MKITYTLVAISVLLISGILIEVDKKYGITTSKKPEQVKVIYPSISEYIDSLPEGALKSNMSAVLGAEYADSSDELNEILQAYAVMKLDELRKQKQNYGKPNTDL